MATHRADVANENTGPPRPEPRLKRGPVELRLPTRADLPPENLDAAYRLLVRFVAHELRRDRREEAVNDEGTSRTPTTPSDHDAA